MSEENKYQFECGVCHKLAIGHKGRVVCDACKGERPKTWGDYHREAIAAGMDDASACHLADAAVP